MPKVSKLRQGEIARVEIDGVRELTDGILEKLMPETKAEMTRGLEAIARRVRAQWPIGPKRKDRSYHSVEKFAISIKIKDGEVVGSVVNTAPWAGMIRRKGLGGVFDLDAEARKLKGLRKNKLVWKSVLVYETEQEMPKIIDAILRDLKI
jgi:hypothetical protein